jgi:hypothetical protein
METEQPEHISKGISSAELESAKPDLSDQTDTDENAKQANGKVAGRRTKSVFQPDLRFWAIIFALCTTALLASLENTIIATSLPFIVADLDVGGNFVWIGNIFFLTRFVLSPC